MATVSQSSTGRGAEEEDFCASNDEGKGFDDPLDAAMEEQGNSQRNKKKRKKKKKKKVPYLMSASGQSDADRRELRKKQRKLHKDIALDVPVAAAAGGGSGGNDDEEMDDEKMEGTEKLLSGKLLSWSEQNNGLWNQVNYTREAVLDSDNVELITNKAAREVEKMAQVPRYDAITLAQNLVKKGSLLSNGINQFNWQGLGFQVGVCFSALPSNCSFLYGPLDKDYKPKERKRVERKRRADAEDSEEDGLIEDQPEIMDEKNKKKGDGNELSAVEEQIKAIGKTLAKRSKEEKAIAKHRVDKYLEQLQEEGIDDEKELVEKKKRFIEENSKVDAVKLLFNPSSFTQTVENIFNFSHTVKEGKSEIKARKVEEALEFGVEPGPVAITRDQNKKKKNTANADAADAPKPPPTQAVLAFTMKDWRDMCAVFEVEEGDLPHREIVSLQKKEDSGAVKEDDKEDGHLPQVSQESFHPDPESSQMTNSVNASEVPQVSQETIVPRQSSEKPAKKARRAFEL